MFKGGMAGMLQKAQKMQEEMQKAQAEIKNLQVEGSAGNGMVKLELSGEYELKSISIDDQLMDDKEFLEDLLVTAYNDAYSKVKQKSESRMKGVTGGMNLPGGMKLPF
jgi:DNA-binding YbaB/EbfC family protein